MEIAWQAGDAVVWRIPGAGGRGFLPDVRGVVTAIGKRAVTIEIAIPPGARCLCDVRPEALTRPELPADAAAPTEPCEGD